MAKQSIPPVEASWTRLEEWCAKHLPELLADLNPGVSEGEIGALERAIGRPLPRDIRRSFSIHNGQKSHADPNGVTGLVFSFPLLPFEEVLSQWQAWQKVDRVMNAVCEDSQKSFPQRAIRRQYTNAGWVPLTHAWSSNHIGVDLNPGPRGVVGQIITFGRDEDTKYVVAKSWSSFLRDLAEELEAGRFTIVEGPGLRFRQLRLADPEQHFHGYIAEQYRRRRGSRGRSSHRTQ